MSTFAQQTGSQAEQRAEKYLRQQGFKFATRNYHSLYGEIDLVMWDQETLVFIEVRYRDKETHGGGLETVTRSKQNKIIKTAKFYLVEHNLWEKVPCRFDVVALAPSSEEQTILWIKDAFQVRYP